MLSLIPAEVWLAKAFTLVLLCGPAAFLFMLPTVIFTPFGACPQSTFQNFPNLLHHVHRVAADRCIFPTALSEQASSPGMPTSANMSR